MKIPTEILKGLLPQHVATVADMVRGQVMRGKLGFASGAGLVTIGFDLTNLFKGVIWFCFIASLIVAYFLVWQISKQSQESASGSDTVTELATPSETQMNILLISVGSFLASAILLIIGAFTDASSDRSILLNTLASAERIESSNQRIESGIDQMVTSALSADLAFKIQFKITDDDKKPDERFHAQIIWPEIDGAKPKKCKLVRETKENDYYTISLKSCDKLTVTMKPIELSSDPQEMSEMLPRVMGQLGSNYPTVNVTLANGKKTQVQFFNLTAEIMARMSRQLRSQSTTAMAELNQAKRKAATEAAEQRQLEENERRQRSDLQKQVSCTLTGCSFGLYADDYLCKKKATKMSLGRTRDTEDVSIDLSGACTETSPDRFRINNDLRCFSVPEDLPALHPGQDIYVRIEFSDEAPIELVVNTSDSRETAQFVDGVLGSSEQNAVTVPLIPADGADPLLLPYAKAWYSPYLNIHTNPYRAELAVGGCYPSIGRQYTSVLTDHDGLGLTPYTRGFNYLSIPEPIDGIVAFAFETEDGTRYGPFRYQLDVESLVAAAAAETKTPTFSCAKVYDSRTRTNSWNCSAPSSRQELLEWLKVKSIKVGIVADELGEAIEINATARYIIEQHQSQVNFRQAPPKTLYDFIPPADASNVYYQLELRDGRVLPVQRLVLD